MRIQRANRTEAPGEPAFRVGYIEVVATPPAKGLRNWFLVPGADGIYRMWQQDQSLRWRIADRNGLPLTGWHSESQSAIAELRVGQ